MRDVKRWRRKRTTWELHAESPRLINVDGNPFGAQPSYPSCYQNFPTTSAELLRWYGSPAGITTQGIFPMDAAAGNQVDALGLAQPFVPNPVGAYPLYNREAVGLLESPAGTYGTAFELDPGSVAQFFSNSGALLSCGGVGDPDAVSALLVWRFTRPPLVAGQIFNRAWGGVALQTWGVWWNPPNVIYLSTVVEGAICAINWPADYGWHWLIVTFNTTTGVAWLHSDTGASSTGNFAGTMNNYAVALGGGFWGLTPAGIQYRYFAAHSGTLTAANGQSFWRHAQARGTGFSTTTYARTTPYVLPASATRVNVYGPGQLATGYTAAAVVPENPLGTGLACEDAHTFLGIGADNLNAWVDGGAHTHAPTDGPSGAMDAVTCNEPVAGTGLLQSPVVALAGATNIPYACGWWIRAGTAPGYRCYVTFSGDPGGAEYLYPTGGIAVPSAAWSQVGGVVTPVGAAHTQCWYNLYSDNFVVGGTLDFAEPFVASNLSAIPLGWARAPTGAATVTAFVDTRATSTAFDPRRGRVRAVIAGLQAIANAYHTFWSTIPVVGARGYMSIYQRNASLYWGIYDSVAASVANGSSPALDSARHIIELAWDCAVPVYRTGGADYYAALLVDGAVVSYGGVAPWTPALPSALSGEAIGFANGGPYCASAFIEQCEHHPDPGTIP